MVRDDLVFHRVYGSAPAIFGKPAADLTGRPARDALDAERRKTWCSRFGAGSRPARPCYLRERAGNAAWYISVFPMRAADGTRYAGAMAREMTPWKTAEQELRNTVLGALKAQEFERNMLSKFLHDVVGQNLTALGLQLDLVRMDLESVSPDTCVRMAEIQKVLETMMEQVREYSYELNPSAVERAGLRSALDRLADRIRAAVSPAGCGSMSTPP